MSEIKHRCFISYHHDDQDEVEKFIKKFDENGDVFIARAIGISKDIIDSDDATYIMKKIRELYLTYTTVTIVMIGKCTWARRFVDWEIASTLRNDSKNKRSGLMAITLPSIASSSSKNLPARFEDNVYDNDKEEGYAKWYKYPSSLSTLANHIEDAFKARDKRAEDIDNSRALYGYNRTCE